MSASSKAPLERLPRALHIALMLGGLALAAFPLVPMEGRDFYLQMLTQMMILAIFAMSLDLLQGVTGLVSLGHAAYFGLAGYALAYWQVFYGGARLFAPVLKGWAVLYPEFRLTPAVGLSQILALLAVTVLPYLVATLIPGWRAAISDPDAVMRG